jgi:hypothetical protein
VCTQNTGTSLLETFDAKQIRVHVDLIRAAAVATKSAQPPPANPDDACKVRADAPARPGAGEVEGVARRKARCFG